MVGRDCRPLWNGQLQIYCVDSVDTESWYNKQAHPYWRVQRHLQYERYILNDVLPLMWNKNWNAADHCDRLQLRRLPRRELRPCAIPTR